MRHKVLRIAMLVVLSLALNVGTVTSQDQPQDKIDAARALTIEATVASKMSYQGMLREEGSPVTGSRDMTFLFHNSSGCTTAAVASIPQPGVQVNEGLFSVNLDVNHSLFNGQELWLRVQVGEDFLGCQEILPVPYALSLRPGAEIRGPQNIAGLVVENTGTGDAIRAYANTTAYNWAAFYGVNAGAGSGVYGSSQDGAGVYGVTSEGQGVYGVATSQTSVAIYGEAKEAARMAIKGMVTADNGVGVWSGTTGRYGVGVYAIATGAQARGLHVEASNNGSIGLIAKGGPGGYGAIFNGNVKIERQGTGIPIIELGEGLDYAEGFLVSDKTAVEPGAVLVIDPNAPGKLMLSTAPYDHKVAGIVSGGKGLGSAVRLAPDQFDYDVALAGRVYCKVDATDAAIVPGDLLTTAGTPGYAMKVTDYARAQGAILGKAMEALAQGEQGLILVLVTLQ